MNIQELKKILKPLLKEILMEVIFEEKGILSHIIKESISATKDINYIPIGDKQQVVREERMFNVDSKGVQSVSSSRLPPKEKQKIVETKKKLLESLGKDAYNGIDVFAGTAPLTTAGDASNTMTVASPLSNFAPEDPGIPIDKIFENAQLWGKIAKRMDKKKNKEVLNG